MSYDEELKIDDVLRKIETEEAKLFNLDDSLNTEEINENN